MCPARLTFSVRVCAWCLSGSGGLGGTGLLEEAFDAADADAVLAGEVFLLDAGGEGFGERGAGLGGEALGEGTWRLPVADLDIRGCGGPASAGGARFFGPGGQGAR
jgi:hypothetical protein